ncbi:anaerobic ribonucleoside-triphosphate reductase activating protein, partial [Bacillus haynesii]
EGLRTVVFLAGCPHMCEGCHNKQSWNINNGFDMSVDEVFEEIMKNPLTNVTYSGGEPLLHAGELIELSEKIKQHSEKDIWLYSGYTYEQILKNEKHSALLAYCDVLVDGPFEIKKRDL